MHISPRLSCRHGPKSAFRGHKNESNGNARVFVILVALNIMWLLSDFRGRRDNDALGKPSIKLTTKDCPSDGGALFTCDLQELLACSAITRGDVE
jgi:hypothetical protein